MPTYNRLTAFSAYFEDAGKDAVRHSTTFSAELPRIDDIILGAAAGALFASLFHA